ncbi:MAG: 7TM domain-containing protein, partial [Ghiorsea sp.]|nr:7TM domain-containing protein [Ghiorsea sp.]
VEVYINGYWVPFDTINNHFAELPANFLTLYYGDKVLFYHSSNVNFKYMFSMTKKLVAKASLRENLDDSILNIANVYQAFEGVGISQNLLKIILMIPIGALVTVIFRNVIGLETFGTFLPALIASAARDTGLFWGSVGFVLVIVLTALVRRGMDWLQLLHSPKMAILLTVVVMIILGATVVSTNLGLNQLAHLSLFPIAILAITAERFSIFEAEHGLWKAFKVTLATLVVVAAAYTVMESQFLQSMFLAFPELLFVLIALNLWLGRWIGMRVTEFFRFRKLIWKEAKG